MNNYPECLKCEHNCYDEEGDFCDCKGEEPEYCPFNQNYEVEFYLTESGIKISKN